MKKSKNEKMNLQSKAAWLSAEDKLKGYIGSVVAEKTNKIGKGSKGSGKRQLAKPRYHNVEYRPTIGAGGEVLHAEAHIVPKKTESELFANDVSRQKTRYEVSERGCEARNSTQSDAAAYRRQRAALKRPGRSPTCNAKNAGTKRKEGSRSTQNHQTRFGASGKDTGAKGKGKGKGTGTNQNIKNEDRRSSKRGTSATRSSHGTNATRSSRSTSDHGSNATRSVRGTSAKNPSSNAKAAKVENGKGTGKSKPKRK